MATIRALARESERHRASNATVPSSNECLFVEKHIVPAIRQFPVISPRDASAFPLPAAR